MRIEKHWPDTNWSTVWVNLWATPVPDSTKDAWYRVIHDIVPTRQRLHAIRLSQTDLCPMCHVKDTLTHRITGCGEGNRQWIWTRQRLAVILRTDPRWICEEWLYRPQFRFWPAQRHRAVLWILAKLIDFRLQKERTLTTCDYFDFLKRSKWKLYQQHNRQSQVGNYLSVIEQ
jgi:hypothetical protein